ncbi:MAG: hypothetical protein V1733_09350 [bacterium]
MTLSNLLIGILLSRILGAAGSIAFLFVYSRITRMPVVQLFTFRRSDFYFFRDIKTLVQLKRTRNHGT